MFGNEDPTIQMHGNTTPNSRIEEISLSWVHADRQLGAHDVPFCFGFINEFIQHMHVAGVRGLLPIEKS